MTTTSQSKTEIWNRTVGTGSRCLHCRPHSQKSYGVRIASIEMKTGEGYLLDGCRAWTYELGATGIVEAQRDVNRMNDYTSRQDEMCGRKLKNDK